MACVMYMGSMIVIQLLIDKTLFSKRYAVMFCLFVLHCFSFFLMKNVIVEQILNAKFV